MKHGFAIVVAAMAVFVNTSGAQPKGPQFTAGTVWTFSVASADPGVNGKKMTVTLEDKRPNGTSEELIFQVSVGDGPVRKVTLWAFDTPWFVPVEYADGQLSIKGIGPHPPARLAPGKQNVSRASRTQYQYDDAGRSMGSKTDLIVVTSVGLAACVVPAGRFACTQTTTKLRTGAVESQIWLNDENPAAILHQIQRPKPKTGLIVFKLASMKKGGS